MPIRAISFADDEFARLRTFVYDNCGIVLDENRRSMVAGRLQPVIARERAANLGEYLARVLGDASGRLRSELVDRLTTNHTFFWREHAHFELYRDQILPELLERRRRSGQRLLRVWCAAASSGQEPYTLAALQLDVLGAEAGDWDAGVLATDISDPMLDMVRRGIYEANDAAHLPEPLLRRYFDRLADGSYAARPELRRELTVRRLNLMRAEFPFRSPFDAVFCRNVMIYFDVETKRELIARLAATMVLGGYFFIGTAESLPAGQGWFAQIHPGVFRRVR